MWKLQQFSLENKIASAFWIREREFDINFSKTSKECLQTHLDWSYVWEIITHIDPGASSNSNVEIAITLFSESEYRSRSITYSIAENEDYIYTLGAYLKDAESSTAIETINVISKLPVLPTQLHEIKLYIDTHKIKKYSHWYTVLGVRFDQLEELFMKMKLLEEILEPESEFSVNEKFMQNQGINFLVDIIMQSCTILINDGRVIKFPLWTALISRTLKLFNKLLKGVELSDYLDDENSLVMIKSGLDFLEFITEVGNNDKILIDLMSVELKRDTVITDIFNMFITVISYSNKRFKSIHKHK